MGKVRQVSVHSAAITSVFHSAPGKHYEDRSRDIPDKEQELIFGGELIVWDRGVDRSVGREFDCDIAFWLGSCALGDLGLFIFVERAKFASAGRRWVGFVRMASELEDVPGQRGEIESDIKDEIGLIVVVSFRWCDAADFLVGFGCSSFSERSGGVSVCGGSCAYVS